jgi:hypothetical protein
LATFWGRQLNVVARMGVPSSVQPEYTKAFRCLRMRGVSGSTAEGSIPCTGTPTPELHMTLVDGNDNGSRC